MRLNFPAAPILLVDDETHLLQSVKATLELAGGTNIHTLDDGNDVLGFLTNHKIDIILLDYLMPSTNGLEVLREIKRDFPEISVIMLTAVNEINTAVNCMQVGAQDFLVKPVVREQIITSINKATEVHSLNKEISNLRHQLFDSNAYRGHEFCGITSHDPKMQAIFKYVEAIADSQEPVLITGETGTGKELLSNAVHECSKRKGAFVAVNTAGLDDNMFSDTLFGHTKGAYTGAMSERKGLIDKAADGTLFLDEVGCLSESSQVKLLRVIQEKAFLPLGSDKPKNTSARIVCAANCDLHEEISKGRFRRDLYYRLRTHAVQLPPLRERKKDIPLLVDLFLKKSAKLLQKNKPTPPPELITLLSSYGFPGNIRELEGMVHNAMSLHNKGKISLSSFKEIILEQASLGTATMNLSPGLEHDFLLNNDGKMPTLKEAETLLISTAMTRAGDNQGIAASFLGISRQALNRRLIRKGRAEQ